MRLRVIANPPARAGLSWMAVQPAGRRPFRTFDLPCKLLGGNALRRSFRLSAGPKDDRLSACGMSSPGSPLGGLSDAVELPEKTCLKGCSGVL